MLLNLGPPFFLLLSALIREGMLFVELSFSLYLLRRLQNFLTHAVPHCWRFKCCGDAPGCAVGFDEHQAPDVIHGAIARRTEIFLNDKDTTANISVYPRTLMTVCLILVTYCE